MSAFSWFGESDAGRVSDTSPGLTKAERAVGANRFQVRRVKDRGCTSTRDQNAINSTVAHCRKQVGFCPTVIHRADAGIFSGRDAEMEGPTARRRFVDNGTIVVRPIVVDTTTQCRSLYISGRTPSGPVMMPGAAT
jgi:hypothetical protein